MKNGHKLIRELRGHSGSKIYLKQFPNGKLYVEKIGNVDRNFERMVALHEDSYPIPKVYSKEDEILAMEYIHGLDMRTYLIHNNNEALLSFLLQILKSFSQTTTQKDYTEIYHKKLSWIDSIEDLPFTKKELINKLPKILPQSIYHGDMTLENIINTNSQFCFIDPVTIEYDSYIFDIAKLRQDLECKWFLRNCNTKLDVKLQNIQERLEMEFTDAFDDNLLILMLLRVLAHCKKNDSDYLFLIGEIKRLWK